MERMEIHVYTRNELVDIAKGNQKEIDKLENAKRTPFGDFCYQEAKKRLAHYQSLLAKFPEDKVFYLHKGEMVKITTR